MSRGEELIDVEALKYSLILSNTTTVSFKEYPIMVKMAATTTRAVSYTHLTLPTNREV